ncbi:MAG: RNA-directed DNA polymerase [Bdellovibrionaceae bacterium]|nr:RNA-directed DNA polymerase [Pseudobdellovibrionaceae bacterium]
MNELDQYIKRKMRVRHYIRYMDDFVLILDSAEEAHESRALIETFLRDHLRLILSPQKVMIGPCREGLAFLGFYVKPGSIRLRGASLRRMKKRILSVEREHSGDQRTSRGQSPLRAVINSYAGHIKYCSDQKYLQEFLLEKAILVNGGACPV